MSDSTLEHNQFSGLRWVQAKIISPWSDSLVIVICSNSSGAVAIRAYFNSLNGGTNVPPLSRFVPPPILCGGLSLNQ